jgi:hypothetical protein
MKTIFLILAITTSVMAQRPSAQKGELLFDFRKESPASAVRISAATQRNVLSKVFRRYLTDQDKCQSDFAGDDSNDYLAAARKAGQIVPSILDMTTGSFTATGQTQTAYVISVSVTLLTPTTSAQNASPSSQVNNSSPTWMRISWAPSCAKLISTETASMSCLWLATTLPRVQ